MKFKVGDRVKIIGEDGLKKYATRDGKHRVNDLLFNTDMREYCGLSFYVESIPSANQYYLTGVTYINYAGKQKSWFFSDEMLKFDDNLNQKLILTRTYNEELL